MFELLDDAIEPTSEPVNIASRRRGAQPHVDAQMYSVEAEQSVLGSLMLEGSAWDAVAEVLTPADFYRADHRIIFSAAAAISEQGGPIDVVTLSEHLERHGQIEQAGGLAYLGTLARDTPTAANIRAYAEIVRERAQLRALSALGTQIIRDSLNGEGRTARDLVAGAQGRLSSIARRELPDRDEYVLVAAADLLRPALEAPEFLVDELLEENVAVGFVGPPESGKSLLALNLAACVATGQVFHGRRCKRGLAVYLAGEGHHGIGRRLQALEKRYQLGLSGAPLIVAAAPASFLDPTEVARVRSAIDRAREQHGVPLMLVIIDTLARFMAPGDESKAQDMGAYLAAVDDIRGDATAISCHHPGHVDGTRGRGSSGWRAGVDAEFTLANVEDVITVTCQKMKDGERPFPFSFRVEKVATDLARADGSTIHSVVLVPTDAQAARPKVTGKNQKLLLAELERLAAVAGEVGIWTEGQLRQIGRNVGMHKNSARDAVLGLRQLHYLVPTIGGSRLAHHDGEGPKDRNGTESTDSVRDVGTETTERSLDLGLSSRPHVPDRGPGDGGV